MEYGLNRVYLLGPSMSTFWCTKHNTNVETRHREEWEMNNERKAERQVIVGIEVIVAERTSE